VGFQSERPGRRSFDGPGIQIPEAAQSVTFLVDKGYQSSTIFMPQVHPLLSLGDRVNEIRAAILHNLEEVRVRHQFAGQVREDDRLGELIRRVEYPAGSKQAGSGAATGDDFTAVNASPTQVGFTLKLAGRLIRPELIDIPYTTHDIAKTLAENEASFILNRLSQEATNLTTNEKPGELTEGSIAEAVNQISKAGHHPNRFVVNPIDQIRLIDLSLLLHNPFSSYDLTISKGPNYSGSILGLDAYWWHSVPEGSSLIYDVNQVQAINSKPIISIDFTVGEEKLIVDESMVCGAIDTRAVTKLEFEKTRH